MKPSQKFYNKHKNIIRTYFKLRCEENRPSELQRKKKYRDTHKKQIREYGLRRRQELRLNKFHQQVNSKAFLDVSLPVGVSKSQEDKS